MARKRVQTELGGMLVKRLAKANRIRGQIQKLEARLDQLEAKLAGVMGVGQPARKARKVRKPARRAKRARRARKMRSSALRNVVTAVLKDAGRPLKIPEILDGMKKRNFKMKSKQPVKALSVKMYTDKTFKVTKPGHFTLA